MRACSKKGCPLPELDGIFTLDQRKVGIMRPQPQATLHVGGSAMFDGGLIANGPLTISGSPITLSGTLVFNGTVSGTALGTGANQIALGNHTHDTSHNHDAAYVNQTGDTMSGKLTINLSQANGMADANGSLGYYEVGNTGSGAAMITFHRHGAFAAYFGLDTDNKFKIGGWSMGAVANRILDDSEVGSGASQLVRRGAGGYIYTNYINTTADAAAGVPAYLAGQNGDGFIRWYPKSVIAPPDGTYDAAANINTTAVGNGGLAQMNMMSHVNSTAITWSGNTAYCQRTGQYFVTFMGAANTGQSAGNAYVTAYIVKNGANAAITGSVTTRSDGVAYSHFGTMWKGACNYADSFTFNVASSNNSHTIYHQGGGVGWDVFITFIPTAASPN